jgi:hypothetical protein
MKSKLGKRSAQVRAMMTALPLNNFSGLEGIDYADLVRPHRPGMGAAQPTALTRRRPCASPGAPLFLPRRP